MKTLVYFTIGGDDDYVSLLKVAVASVRQHGEIEADIMVMCEHGYKHNLKHVEGIDDVFLLEHPLQEHVEPIVVTGRNARAGRRHVINPPAPTPKYMLSSMQKTRIFEYPKIWEYDRALFLDCDIVCMNPLTFMDYVTEDKLYVLSDECSHATRFYSLCQYTKDHLEFFERNNIGTFNCGQFAFKICDAMQKHFENVCSLIDDTKTYPNFYYEQSHMNHYFNLNNLTIPLLNEYVSLPYLPSWSDSNMALVHFAYGNISYKDKLKQMEQTYASKHA